MFYSTSDTKVPACVGEKSINQLSLASTYLKSSLLWIHYYDAMCANIGIVLFH